MYLKLVFISLAFMAVGATLLVWQSQRIEMRREAAQMRLETTRVKERIWKEDLKLSEMLDPDELRTALKDIHMDLRVTKLDELPKHEQLEDDTRTEDERTEMRRVQHRP